MTKAVETLAGQSTQLRNIFSIALCSENARTKLGGLFSLIVNPPFLFSALKPVLHASGRKRYNTR